ncbi:hypothetical protein DXG03_000684 [Asterophora parasitica]|uniref:EF-hand domain-containing protein n=1 Tax=Asterophora parasitica TaxID=117018 RepID=A0A9P7KAM8_9AGAR|nr:hypothetical protein DXG03_000684 [Asterophora parasitica]
MPAPLLGRQLNSMLSDTNGFWERDELEAVYGVHHVYSKKDADQETHQKKADFVVDTVLAALDLDHDGRVSLAELEKVGLDGLPTFDNNMGADGHHYDVESEFFLHHEEQYHSTPETQTDEAYNHPEDLEHFAQHEAIEHQEAEKEAKFQGITVEEVLASQEHHDTPPAADGTAPEATLTVPETPHPHDGQPEAILPLREAPPPKVTRVTPPEKQDPSIRFKDAPKKAAEKGEWGTGEAGYKRPSEPAERLRKNMPYKPRMQYKFRRNWGDF